LVLKLVDEISMMLLLTDQRNKSLPVILIEA
jgi:hypothetical protein